MTKLPSSIIKAVVGVAFISNVVSSLGRTWN